MSRYQSFSYLNLERWASYWYQIREVLNLKPEKILEIGVGNGTVYEYLKNLHRETLSLDIDATLQPDIVASVEKMPLPDGQFDVVLCAEVLEHLPFEKFGECLREIGRVSRRWAIVTLPHWGRHFSFQFCLPGIGVFKFQKKFNFFPIEHAVGGRHYWEIGKKNYPLRKIKSTIESSGFIIRSDYVIFEMPYHHVFVLEKKS